MNSIKEKVKQSEQFKAYEYVTHGVRHIYKNNDKRNKHLITLAGILLKRKNDGKHFIVVGYSKYNHKKERVPYSRKRANEIALGKALKRKIVFCDKYTKTTKAGNSVLLETFTNNSGCKLFKVDPTKKPVKALNVFFNNMTNRQMLKKITGMYNKTYIFVENSQEKVFDATSENFHKNIYKNTFKEIINNKKIKL